MQMKLRQPRRIRELFGREKNWLKFTEIANGLGIHQNTVRKMMRGDTINEDTVRIVADALDAHPLDIAEFVNSEEN